jgi:hypothetical protein
VEEVAPNPAGKWDMTDYRTLHEIQASMDTTARHIERQAEQDPPNKHSLLATAKGWKDAAAYVRKVMAKEKDP